MRKFIYKITYPFIRLFWKTFKPKTYGSRAIVLFENKILLVRNINVDHWSLPGGKIDKNENPKECLIRELKEELDLNIVETEYKLGEYLSNKEGKKDTIFIFIVKLVSPDFEKKWELRDARWFQLNDLPKDLSSATNRRILEFLAGEKNVIKDW